MPSDEGQATDAAGGLRGLGAAPFGETANPADYVPRDATEAALRELEQAFRAGRIAAVTAPPGLGKSLLLRLLADRLGDDVEAAYLAYAALDLDELCAWTLGLLARPASPDPQATLLRFARSLAEEGRLLALFIDDANSMPPDTARALRELLRASGGRLRIVLAAADDAVSARVLAALYPEVCEVRFREVMSPRETLAYVRTRLEQAGVPASLRDRFDEKVIGTIHRLSGGVPRRIHELSSSLLQQPPEEVGHGWLDESWLGTPLEEGVGEATDEVGDDIDHIAAPPPPDVLIDEDEDPDAL